MSGICAAKALRQHLCERLHYSNIVHSFTISIIQLY